MRTRSRTAMFAATAVLLLCGAAASAAQPMAAAPAVAKPQKTLKILTPEQVDPARLLPPPPEDGSSIQKADLAEVQRVYRTRTPERYERAKWDDTHEDSMLFASTLGPNFDLAKLPQTAKLLAVIENDQSVAANMAKRQFLRNRPWAIDPSIVACDYKPNAAPKTSYPSGHATLSYSVGIVLADLIPEKSQAILARAAEYAYSREVCGAHYASDTEASHVLGTVVALQFLSSPKAAPMIEAARHELRVARLTGANTVATAAMR
ncbi:phosphatase PAP2 family protein [Phenylobacterium sp.]|uniref:acid phosphatase n=1 Tax=Phenylobacterium sp. TaxID=1871053 RepID=UPI002E2FFF6C|nr:phosphatase PAP2 family protein [Phenylobacterium sp.]HEX4712127.1 phosphatase PAP2 family protein [Phenylobacterium sp.]